MKARHLVLGCLCSLSVPLALASEHNPVSSDLVAADSLQWEEIVPGVAFAAAFGDWRSGAHGKFVRIDPDVTTPVHRHSLGYHAVVVSGTVINPYDGDEDSPRMQSGDYWSTAAGADHATGCVSEKPCLIYTHMDGPWDIEVVDAAEAAE